MSVSRDNISIAVLPFRNVTGNPEEDYLVDGIVEEIIHALSRLRAFQVVSRSSSFYFRDRGTSLAEIRKQLGVHYVLEGSVRKVRQQIRLAVQLTNLNTGYLMWSESYDRNIENVLALQDEIAQLVARKFLSSNVLIPTILSVQVPGNDLVAYDFYLKGRYYFYRYTMENIEKSLNCFKRAIERQPDFAQAHAFLAFAFMALGGYVNPKYLKEGRQFALNAIALNPQLEAAYFSLCLVQMVIDQDWQGAKSSIEKALAINPRSSEAHRIYGIYYAMQGQLQHAIYEHELALKYDPLNILFLRGLGMLLSFAGRYEEALNEFNRCLELDLDFRPAVETIGWVYAFQGDWDTAIEYFRKYRKLVDHPLKGFTELGYALGKADQREEAYELIALLERRKKAFNEPLDLDYALIWLGLGDHDKTFFHLRKSITDKTILTIFLFNLDPVFDELRTDARWFGLSQQLGLDKIQQINTLNSATVLQLQSTTKERLRILSNQLLYVEAEGNYSRVFWKDGKHTSHKFLRIPLAKLMEQINLPFILQCHRSFVVNLQQFHTLRGNSKKSELLSNNSDQLIPVSRSYRQAVLAVLQD